MLCTYKHNLRLARSCHIRPEWVHGDQISLDQLQTLWSSLHHDDASLFGAPTAIVLPLRIDYATCPYLICSCSCSIVRLIQTAALICRPSYDTDRRLLTRSTYLSDSGPCTSLPVYKRPVFQQSSPKLDLVSNTNALESSLVPPRFTHFLHKQLRVVSSNTRDFYLFKVLATSSPLSTSRTIKAHWSLNIIYY